MRVVQLGPYPPPHGGVQTNLVAIRQYLRSQGIPCSAINITRHRKVEEDDVYYPNGALELIWDLFRKRYDLVHLHIGGMVPLRVVLLGLVASAVPWAKSVLTFHSGGYPNSDQGKATDPRSLRALMFRRFDSVITVNDELVKFFLRLGVSAGRVRKIAPNAVATATIADTLTEPLASFFAAHDPVLLGVCGLEPEYDLPRQIEALKPIRATYPNAGLAIVGSGSLESQIRLAIQSSSCSEHISLCGDVPHAVTMRAIADCRMLLRTTLYDGDAISVREALFLGTPVIATDNGMRPDGVRLIPAGDTGALVDAVRAELRDPVRAKTKLQRDDQNLAAVLDLYRNVLGHKRP
jgi:glycosyltransferase involved in cell wall biosynthesis